MQPKANTPNKEFPTAAPFCDAVVAEVADPFTQPEKVYLFLVVDAIAQLFDPKANMPTVPATTGVTLLLAALKADGPYALLALTVNV